MVDQDDEAAEGLAQFGSAVNVAGHILIAVFAAADRAVERIDDDRIAAIAFDCVSDIEDQLVDVGRKIEARRQ